MKRGLLLSAKRTKPSVIRKLQKRMMPSRYAVFADAGMKTMRETKTP